ncbi:hypothetical protein U9M48_012736 [Paspalum notatum var. saurae]|uniref:ABC transmembrane type-1 domain-containing protein n=1 Tax=Paspalum notatum var. saurae TaxID=547442 RepID=A0AAQ3WIU1_PASNO
MAISTWSARLLVTPASCRATLASPRLAANYPSSFTSRRCIHLTRPRPHRPGAYISAPAPGPEAAYAPPSLDAAAAAADVAAAISSSNAVTWAGVWALLSRHRVRIAVSLAALLACTTCTLSMPFFSGKFFETLIGRGNEPLWRLLAKITVLYTLEPIFTIIFVVNMTIIWEQVMARLRSQIFRRILIQKMVFFDRHKVGELTGLLTSDLGSLKNIITGTLGILFTLSTELAPVLGFLMVSVSVLVALFKRSTVPTFKAYGIVQARISDCASETFSAIRTVRSFGGEKRQISLFDNLARVYQNSGTKLGLLKSANESLTRVVVYVSLMALYILGGSKVNAKGAHDIVSGANHALSLAVRSGGIGTGHAQLDTAREEERAGGIVIKLTPVVTLDGLNGEAELSGHPDEEVGDHRERLRLGAQRKGPRIVGEVIQHHYTWDIHKRCGRGDQDSSAKWWKKWWWRRQLRKSATEKWKKVQRKEETEGCKRAPSCYNEEVDAGKPNPSR